jgi:hypothetical protein
LFCAAAPCAVTSATITTEHAMTELIVIDKPPTT